MFPAPKEQGNTEDKLGSGKLSSTYKLQAGRKASGQKEQQDHMVFGVP